MQKRYVALQSMSFGCFIMFAIGLTVGMAGAVDPTFVGTGMQCPNDIDNRPYGWATGGPVGAEDFDHNQDGTYDLVDPNAVCRRVGVTDGYALMPDGSNVYLFGFVDLTGVPEQDVVDRTDPQNPVVVEPGVISYKLHAHLPAPTIIANQGQKLYLTETNLSLFVRPDLFDPHTVHFHGFPHAMAIFDGVPENSIAVPGGRDFTYFYQLNDAGTYPYHCHVEPVEHIQMGMIGSIVVKAASDTPTAATHYAYDGADATHLPNTQYDVAYSLLIDELDPDKHWNLENIQEGANLWHEYRPSYFVLNGRPYPDTVLPDDNSVESPNAGATVNQIGYSAQKSSLITAQSGQKILLRLNSLGYRTHTLTIPGVKMHVVGEDAKVLRGPDPDGTGSSLGQDVSFWKTTYSIAGGKTADIILDTTGLATGTYFLYGRELNTQSNLSRDARLANDTSDHRGGMMTEIRIQ